MSKYQKMRLLCVPIILVGCVACVLEYICEGLFWIGERAQAWVESGD